MPMKIHGKSEAKHFDMQPDFERGLPPNLFADLKFEDVNNNGIVEAEESVKLHVTIKNKGKGPAQGLTVYVKDSVNDPEFRIKDKKEIAMIRAGQSKHITIPIEAGFDVSTARHKLKISVTEHYGHDMDPAYLILNSLEYQRPKLVLSGMEIVRSGGKERQPLRGMDSCRQVKWSRQSRSYKMWGKM